ncbi:hypothetical protein ACFXK0_12210 [Nocardia sp. NPDC059177]|uniref:hypothetical protein n=1 Tax=Nocardia sp. NPDC059177 TaxID=3346759 RepID=UPI00368046A9
MGDGSGSPLTSTLPGALIITPAVEALLNGKQQQAGAQQQQEGLSGGTEAAYITGMEAFEGFSHEEIYDGAQRMQPGVMQQFGDGWVEISSAVSGAMTGLAIQTSRATGDLRGAMATAGDSAGKTFLSEVHDLAAVVSSVGHRVKAAGYGAEAVKAAVPPPVTSAGQPAGDTSIPPALAILVDGSAPSTAASTEREKIERLQQAVTAMNTIYKPTFQPAGDNVPEFLAPTQPGGNGLGNDGGTNPSPSGEDGQPSTADSPSDDPDGVDDEDGTDNGENDTETPDSDTNTNLDDDSTDDDSTDAASTNPSGTTPATTIPATTTPGAGAPNTPAGSGIPLGSGLPGSPGARIPQAEAPVPGRAGSPSGASLSGGNTSGSSNRLSGMPAMMNPGAAAGKRSNEDEDVHVTADYLRGVQPELFDILTQSPPDDGGIGSDAPSTRPAEDGS